VNADAQGRRGESAIGLVLAHLENDFGHGANATGCPLIRKLGFLVPLISFLANQPVHPHHLNTAGGIGFTPRFRQIIAT
jgi:hypothetical protein